MSDINLLHLNYYTLRIGLTSMEASGFEPQSAPLSARTRPRPYDPASETIDKISRDSLERTSGSCETSIFKPRT